MNDRRQIDERRGYDPRLDRGCKCDRRVQPDRRLSNIHAEWVPINHIKLHPATRLVFSKH